MSAPYIPPLSIAGEAAIRLAADNALQAEIDALEAAGATDAELAAALALKQDALTAATDAELATAVANATATLNASIALKQAAADAATDAELAAHAADTTAVHGIANTANLILEGDARLTDARAPTAHTHTSAAVTDFTEAVQDAVAALLGEGTNITLTYDDAADELTITAAGGGGGGTDPEAVRDAIGVALVGVGLISIAVDDPGDTITISTTATANATDAALRDRTTHTGAQEIATVTGLQAALDAKATSAALTAHTGDTANPHAVTKAQVGLANVDNTSDASKPVSTATQTALDAKAATATLAASGKGYVNHGAVAGTARPAGYASVEWVGSVEPTNAVNGDTWVDTA